MRLRYWLVLAPYTRSLQLILIRRIASQELLREISVVEVREVIDLIGHLKWFSRARMQYSVHQDRTFPDPQDSTPQKRGWIVGRGFQRAVVRLRQQASQWSVDYKPRSGSTGLR